MPYGLSGDGKRIGSDGWLRPPAWRFSAMPTLRKDRVNARFAKIILADKPGDTNADGTVESAVFMSIRK